MQQFYDKANKFTSLVNGKVFRKSVTPNWFAHQHAQSNIDFQGHANIAFEVLTGGYAQKFDPNQGWQQVTGSKAKATWQRTMTDRVFRIKPAESFFSAMHPPTLRLMLLARSRSDRIVAKRAET
jgi:hypothetical protein